MVRIRKYPTEDTIYIGETSEIEWDNDLHLTIVDEFDLWAKIPVQTYEKTQNTTKEGG